MINIFKIIALLGALNLPMNLSAASSEILEFRIYQDMVTGLFYTMIEEEDKNLLSSLKKELGHGSNTLKELQVGDDVKISVNIASEAITVTCNKEDDVTIYATKVMAVIAGQKKKMQSPRSLPPPQSLPPAAPTIVVPPPLSLTPAAPTIVPTIVPPAAPTVAPPPGPIIPKKRSEAGYAVTSEFRQAEIDKASRYISEAQDPARFTYLTSLYRLEEWDSLIEILSTSKEGVLNEAAEILTGLRRKEGNTQGEVKNEGHVPHEIPPASARASDGSRFNFTEFASTLFGGDGYHPTSAYSGLPRDRRVVPPPQKPPITYHYWDLYGANSQEIRQPTYIFIDHTEVLEGARLMQNGARNHKIEIDFPEFIKWVEGRFQNIEYRGVAGAVLNENRQLKQQYEESNYENLEDLRTNYEDLRTHYNEDDPGYKNEDHRIKIQRVFHHRLLDLLEDRGDRAPVGTIVLVTDSSYDSKYNHEYSSGKYKDDHGAAAMLPYHFIGSLIEAVKKGWKVRILSWIKSRDRSFEELSRAFPENIFNHELDTVRQDITRHN